LQTSNHIVGVELKMNISQIAVMILAAGVMFLLVYFVLPNAPRGTATPVTSIATTTMQYYRAVIASNRMNVSDFDIINVSYANLTVYGLVIPLYSANAPIPTELHLGNLVGYGCAIYPTMMLEGINANDTAVFIQISAPESECRA
jgi:hypothetical protein